MKKILKKLSVLICEFLIIVCAISIFTSSKDNISTPIRNVELSEQNLEIDYNFKSFDSYDLNFTDGKVDFIGYDSIKLSDLYDFDLVSTNTIDTEVITKYSSSYDYLNGIVSLSASLINGEETPIIDTIDGVIIMNEKNNFDVIFDVDGEVLLLSELQDSNLIENCGFWSKIKKVWNTKAGKVGTIITAATCATVGVICAVVPGGQLVAAACIGAAVGAVGGAITAVVSTYIKDGVVDWDAVLCYSGAGAVVGGATATVSFKMTNAIKKLFPKSNPSSEVKGFDSYYKFKKEFGKASDYIEIGEWHHIVEQQTIEKGINSSVSIYNTQNTVAIPKELHVKISSYYSSYNSVYGMTNRAYINTLTYKEQYLKGIEILEMFANEMGITPFWL